MAPNIHLALINVFSGDIQGGLGPFLGTWLAATAQWSPSEVGLVATLGGLGALLFSGPLGALVDHFGRPRLLIAVSASAILAGMLALLPATGFAAVLGAQLLAAIGGTLLLLAITALTLGIVGKEAFPRQQGTNQAFNHVGILTAAALIGLGTPYLGPATALWILGAMAAATVAAAAMMPANAWHPHRCCGWEEDAKETPKRHSVRQALSNRRLYVLALALALFQLGNGGMLTLLGQKLVASDPDGTRWTAIYVMAAQLTMIPVAYFAGRLADRRGRRQLLVVACAALVVRAGLTALLDDPFWLIATEVLDGLASGIMGVAVPIVVADLTWGSGRTQTALGSVNAIQGIGGALSAGFGGIIQGFAGWTTAFLALGAAGLAALLIVWWLEATTEDSQRLKRRRRREQAMAEA